MDALLETIRTAVLPDASDETRAAGASACRTLLTALEAKPGEALTAPTAPAAPTAATSLPIAAVVGALRGMPPEQLLDLAIARLKAALPAGTEIAPVQSLRFQLLPVRKLGGGS